MAEQFRIELLKKWTEAYISNYFYNYDSTQLNTIELLKENDLSEVLKSVVLNSEIDVMKLQKLYPEFEFIYGIDGLADSGFKLDFKYFIEVCLAHLQIKDKSNDFKAKLIKNVVSESLAGEKLNTAQFFKGLLRIIYGGISFLYAFSTIYGYVDNTTENNTLLFIEGGKIRELEGSDILISFEDQHREFYPDFVFEVVLVKILRGICSIDQRFSSFFNFLLKNVERTEKFYDFICDPEQKGPLKFKIETDEKDSDSILPEMTIKNEDINKVVESMVSSYTAELIFESLLDWRYEPFSENELDNDQ